MLKQATSKNLVITSQVRRLDKESGRVDSKIGRLTILSFALARGITNLPGLVISLLLIEVGETFGVPVGIAGQLATASSILAITFAVLMGVASVRYNHKTLLAYGLLLYVISASFTYFAGSFILMMIFFSLFGIANAMVYPMINALIGELIPIEKRTSAIGWTIAGLALIYLAGALAANYLASISSWRMALLLIVTPITLVTLVLVYLRTPRIQSHSNNTMPFSGYFGGYAEILKNKSALACLLATILGLATWSTYLVYGPSFWRQVYGLSRGFVSIVLVIMPLTYVVGSLLTGRLTEKLGRKSLSALTLVLLGACTFVAFSAPFALLSIGLSTVSSFFAGMMLSVSTSLTLEQLPRYKGTMMSTHSAATSMGGMTAAILGGVILLFSDYSTFGFVMGVIGITGALIFFLYTKDPTQTEIH
jgi:predicted MFS family arabinose efflux permease